MDPDQPDAHLHVSPVLLARARELRHPLTPAEKKLWAAVRNQQLGFKIRRQHPIWRFIADLYCEPARLVVEINGDIHAAPDQAAYDTARTEWLELRGYHVIRFHNDDIHRNLSGVLAVLKAACEARLSQLPKKPTSSSPSPRSKAPSPSGKRPG
jgi:very-short-patch-repair endonuclease